MASSVQIPAPLAIIKSTLLEGDWPILGRAEGNPVDLFTQIKKEALGTAITTNFNYLNLGLFLISTELLDPHPVQRKTNLGHVQTLKNDFIYRGIFRLENPGVVIGLGDGWLDMLRGHKHGHIRITSTSPHLARLASSPNGKIGQVIRGGHRTQAVYELSKSPPFFDQAYWAYNVLIPGKLLINIISL